MQKEQQLAADPNATGANSKDLRPAPPEPKSGLQMIAKEREEQIFKHGFNLYGDRFHDKNELIHAALFAIDNKALADWPEGFSLKYSDAILKKTKVERLSVAGALIAAEIDRLNGVSSAETATAYVRPALKLLFAWDGDDAIGQHICKVNGVEIALIMDDAGETRKRWAVYDYTEQFTSVYTPAGGDVPNFATAAECMRFVEESFSRWITSLIL